MFLFSMTFDLGLFGVTVDEAYGGAGMSQLAHMVTVAEIARIIRGEVGAVYQGQVAAE